MISVVSAAVEVSSETILQDIRQGACPASTVSTVQTSRFEIDHLKQYSRRDNISIVGVLEKENENCTKVVKELGTAMGVAIKDSDVSTAHRVKSRRKRGNAIVVRFVRSSTKAA